jgi:hypothetical protein
VNVVLLFFLLIQMTDLYSCKQLLNGVASLRLALTAHCSVTMQMAAALSRSQLKINTFI